MPLRTLELSSFEVAALPDPAELGRALERKARPDKAVLRFRFGEAAASFAISDLWSACCELLLQAQLVREKRLNRFVLDVEHVFDVSCAPAVVLCRFSSEHVFAVATDEFASALEQVVERILAGTSCPRLMEVAVRRGASAIRAQPYSYRFSDSFLI